ncbi:MAG: hypothetical protein ACOZDD_17495 [Bacteroidota bacterium]
MKTIKSIKSQTINILKNFFFILNFGKIYTGRLKNEPDKSMVSPSEPVLKENSSPEFEEYREMYMTRCRWS